MQRTGFLRGERLLAEEREESPVKGRLSDVCPMYSLDMALKHIKKGEDFSGRGAIPHRR